MSACFVLSGMFIDSFVYDGTYNISRIDGYAVFPGNYKQSLTMAFKTRYLNEQNG